MDTTLVGWFVDAAGFVIAAVLAIHVAYEPLRRFTNSDNVLRLVIRSFLFESQKEKQFHFSSILIWTFTSIVVWALGLVLCRAIFGASLAISMESVNALMPSIASIFESSNFTTLTWRVFSVVFSLVILDRVLRKTQFLAESNFGRVVDKDSLKRQHKTEDTHTLHEEIGIYVPEPLKVHWLSFWLLPGVMERLYRGFIFDQGKILNGNARMLIQSIGVDTFNAACHRLTSSAESRLPDEVVTELKECIETGGNSFEVAKTCASVLLEYLEQYSTAHRMVLDQAWFLQQDRANGDNIRRAKRRNIAKNIRFSNGRLTGIAGQLLDCSKDGSGVFVSTIRGEEVNRDQEIVFRLGRRTIVGVPTHHSSMFVQGRLSNAPGFGVRIEDRSSRRVIKRFLLTQ